MYYNLTISLVIVISLTHPLTSRTRHVERGTRGEPYSRWHNKPNKLD